MMVVFHWVKQSLEYSIRSNGVLMKKRRLIVTGLFFCLIFLFSSCGGTAGKGPSLVGNWKVIKTGDTDVSADESQKSTICFHKDGVMTVEEERKDAEGKEVVEKFTYKTDNVYDINRLVIEGSMGDKVYSIFKFENNGEVIVIKMTDKDQGAVYSTNFNKEDGFYIEKWKRTE